MEKKEKVLQYRKRLDSTLISPKLTSKDSVRALVKSKLFRSSSSGQFEGDPEKVVEKHTADVWNFLQMLRSVPGNENDIAKSQSLSQDDWKLKKDDGQLRVMYREAPNGTPFHTLLAEGYVNGPIDVCLCVSWESELYSKWWPQAVIPPFKILLSTSLKKIRVGEQISLVRMKVPWPLSVREAIVHFFELELYEDGLVIVLFNSIDVDHVNVSTDGFTSDGIPEPKDVVRMDLIGGFALQKVSSDKSYFRTIANLDMKLEFMPPALINFVARHLVGNGFKLYEKAIISAAKGDKDFDTVLANGPLYVQLRNGLLNLGESVDAADHSRSEHSSEITDEQTVAIVRSPMHVSEIEIDDEQVAESSFGSPCSSESSGHEKETVSHEVKLALEMLDTAISLVRERTFTLQSPIQTNNVLDELVSSNSRTNGPLRKEAEVHTEEANEGTIANNMRHLEAEPATSLLPNVGIAGEETSPWGEEAADKSDSDNSRKRWWKLCVPISRSVYRGPVSRPSDADKPYS
ncbi:hypothetical protein EJ110_NYTH15052 [Nymphaea thermarum]|nr:hypothetical protein EJ110_NYTH15052 [Nymphaea thermarum]